MMLTPNQEHAIRDKARHMCVDAGAGSGKTRVLVDRIIHLIEQKTATLDEIVAITFTDKAAAEMRDRLRQAFRQRAPLDDSEEMSRWRTLEHRVDTARISTIHAFCAGILRENALFCGLDPDFVVMTEAETTLLREQIVLDTLHNLLDQEEPEAVHAATELGVTRLANTLGEMLTARGVVTELLSALQPDTPEALVPHWRAVAEQAQSKRLEELVDSPVVHLCREKLMAADGICTNPKDSRERERGHMLAILDQLYEHPDAERIQALLTEITDIKFIGTRKTNWTCPDTYEQLKTAQETLKSLAKDTLPDPFDDEIERRSAELTCAMLNTFRRIHDAFTKTKTSRTSLDFDDLIALAHAVLRDNEVVRARLAHGMRFLLIDEFQDTDSLQLSMATLLSQHEGGPDLFIVGDAKQSIYDFRGAEVAVFQSEKTHTENLIRLDTNFRSAPEIMGFINETFAHSGLLHAVEPLYQPMTTNRASTGECRIEFLIPPTLASKNTEAYRSNEAELIAARLDQMCRGPHRVSVYDKDLGREREAEFGDVALLFRSTTSVYLYEKALRARNIPFLVAGGSGFYERQEVADIHTLLRVLVNPWDEPALLSFLRGPIAALSDESLMRLATGGLSTAFLDPTRMLEGEQGMRLQAARDLVTDLQQHTESPLGSFVRRVLDRTDYEAIALNQYLGIQKASNVRKLVDLADDFSRMGPARLQLFVHYLDSLAGRDEIREGDAVIQPGGAGPATLMSIHKSKGLEFPIVVIADSARQRNNTDPGNLAVDRKMGAAAKVIDQYGEMRKPAVYQEIQIAHTQADINESARILYVAMTRARDWLLIGGSPEPGSGSWFATLDMLYSVIARNDGDSWMSSAESLQPWSACVRRTEPAPSDGVTRNTNENVSPVSLETVQTRMAHIQSAILSPATRNTISVSKLLDIIFAQSFPDDQDEERILEKRLPPDQDPLLRGVLAHRLLECWDKMDSDPVGTLLTREYPVLIENPKLCEYLRGLVEHFRTSSLCARLEGSENLSREAAFVLRLDNGLVRGVIDLILDDGTLVDYKTGSPRPEHQKRYVFQLQLYAAAVRDILGQTPPSALLYYVDSGEAHPVAITPSDIETARQIAIQAMAASGTTAPLGKAQ